MSGLQEALELLVDYLEKLQEYREADRPGSGVGVLSIAKKGRQLSAALLALKGLDPATLRSALATPAPAGAVAGGEERATELLDEWRDLLIQERLANRSWDSLTEEERRIPTGTEYSRSSRRISLEQRTLDFQGEEEVRQRMALKIAAIRAALQPEPQS